MVYGSELSTMIEQQQEALSQGPKLNENNLATLYLSDFSILKVASKPCDSVRNCYKCPNEKACCIKFGVNTAAFIKEERGKFWKINSSVSWFYK